jgi:hypothetical protein
MTSSLCVAQFCPTAYAQPSVRLMVLPLPANLQCTAQADVLPIHVAHGAFASSLSAFQVVYATACCSNGPQGDGSFLPLSVHYQERFSAAGRTRWVGVKGWHRRALGQLWSALLHVPCECKQPASHCGPRFGTGCASTAAGACDLCVAQQAVGETDYKTNAASACAPATHTAGCSFRLGQR